MNYLFNNLYQKRFGGNNKIATVSIKLGSTKGRGSSTRINNYYNDKYGIGSGIFQFIKINLL
jgi:hypothetical protein